MKKNYLLLFVLLAAFVLMQSGLAQTPVMNEIYSRGVPGNLDWIEIYNPTSSPVDIGGYKIYDSGGKNGTKPKKLFPANTIIPAKGFTVIITDTVDFDGDLSDFGLSSSGEWVWLENTSGEVIDSVLFGVMSTSQSYGRLPDGGNWQLLENITRGFSNVISGVNYVFMNEIYSRGVTGNLDWIEIYNTSSAEVDLSGYKIYDSGGKNETKPKKLFPANTIIPAKGFTVIITDTASFDGDLSGFGLSSGGEWVWLEDASGILIDSVLFAAMDVTQSYGRLPDGETWQLLDNITRGFSNVVPVVNHIFMNEIYSRGVPGNLDWIEIYNESDSDVDISGYKIYDSGGNSGSKPKKEFPLGTVVPAKGFTVIITDTASFDGDLSGFGLSSNGEEVWLEDNMGTVIDNVVFTAMDVTQSYGRFPDGSPNWQLLNFITRGAPNLLTSVENEKLVISDFMLYQNYPNPFNPSTTISYQIAKQGLVSLVVYNVLGKEVATLVNEVKSRGKYEIKFDASNLSSGIYFYKLTADGFTSTKKFTLIK